MSIILIQFTFLGLYEYNQLDDDEKLEFSDGKYRTPQFKKGFGLIYQQIKELEGNKKKTEGS